MFRSVDAMGVVADENTRPDLQAGVKRVQM
jgi:hypothetical protein